jgi:N-acetylmuramoyl-L-alanine amidase
MLLLVASSATWAKPVVTGIRIGVHPGATRVVLDLTEDARHTIFTLPNPYRVVIDLPEVEWRLARPAPLDARGLVLRFRYGLFQPGTSRVVLDLGGPALVRKTFMLRPMANFGYRLVLDLSPVSAEQYSLQAQPPPRAPEPPPLPPEAAPRGPGKLVVVVDPGHGGVDPGTIGVSGIHEKHIALQAGLELRRQLEASGKYTVVMTRDQDVFVRLERRVAVARAAGADLFISLHADSIAKKHTRGATVYTLSEQASDQEAAALAAKENTADVIAGIDLTAEAYGEDVTKILIDLAQRKTMNISAEFAGGLISELGKATRLLRETHRFAGFRVLKAPDVPSALVELGYLSNRDDERILRDPNHRRGLMRAIVRAVDRFFATRQAASSL